MLSLYGSIFQFSIAAGGIAWNVADGMKVGIDTGKGSYYSSIREF
jgi:hypothetical protein